MAADRGTNAGQAKANAACVAAAAVLCPQTSTHVHVSSSCICGVAEPAKNGSQFAVARFVCSIRTFLFNT